MTGERASVGGGPPPSSPAGTRRRTAVLFSGGLDSAVLLADEARRAEVLPVYVSAGLAWEAEERAAAERVLSHPVFRGRALAMITLSLPVDDVYPPGHWALRGEPPAYDTPDDDVYLVGRNLLLLAKAGILCAREGIHALALGPLAGNPFPDARPAFFTAMAAALSLGLDQAIEIVRPLEHLHKAEVVALGASLGVPFELTLSCMNPSGTAHCGACSKCRERRQAFAEAGVEDPTEYLTRRARTSARPRLS